MYFGYPNDLPPLPEHASTNDLLKTIVSEYFAKVKRKTTVAVLLRRTPIAITYRGKQNLDLDEMFGDPYAQAIMNRYCDTFLIPKLIIPFRPLGQLDIGNVRVCSTLDRS